MAGYDLNIMQINQRAGNLACALRDNLVQIQRFKGMLDTLTTETMVAMGFTSDEVATLKSAFTDLDKLRQVYEGTDTVTTAYNFRTFAQRLEGTF